MKKIILVLFVLTPFVKLSAQNSEIERIFRSANYIQYKTIVRNYSDTINVLMQYGYSINTVYEDSIKASSSFMIQNTITGDITHIVDLPKGYQVNDVRFVSLRRIDGVTTEDFCVFCGTRTQFDDIVYLPALPDEPSQYYYVYSKHGFAGFFSMNEAMSPSSSFTAKVRDVEKTKELYKMTCYAEQYGHYYSFQNTFIDNAVLDIIGLDDTVSAPSCFCRAKFYPDCYGNVRWDNNIRLNYIEELTDITLTDDYVVTSSNHITGNTQWIRYSNKEDHLVSGGEQLSSHVNAIDFTVLTVQTGCNSSFDMNNLNRIDPAKICHTKNNEIEMSFRIEGHGYDGLINSQYGYYNETLSYLQGSYLKCTPLVKELIYMPSNNSTAVLYNESRVDIVSIITWNKNQYCVYPVKQFYDNNIKAHSITLQERNGFEHLFWSGMEKSNLYSPMYLMSQRGFIGGGYEQTCHYNNNIIANPVIINHNVTMIELPIIKRFPYDEISYPVTYVHFTPYELNKEYICIK